MKDKKNITSCRLKQLMQERKLKQVDILNLSIPYQLEFNITMNKSSLSQYINGRSNPDQHKLFLLSQTLGVSEAWLMGYDVPMNAEDHNPTVTRIVEVVDQLTENNQESVYEFAQNKLEEQQLE